MSGGGISLAESECARWIEEETFIEHEEVGREEGRKRE